MDWKCTLTLTVLLLHAESCQSTTAAADTTTNYHFFATKNTYAHSKRYFYGPDTVIADKHSELQRQLHDNSCQPLQLNALLRHGTRNPGRKDMQRLDAFFTRVDQFVYEHGRADSDVALNLNLAMLEWFQSDLFAHAWNNDKQLVAAGYAEMAGIGRFVARHFASLLDDGDAAARLEFMSSDTQRTLTSCTAFKDGLGMTDLDEPCQINDHLMRFFDDCPRYVMDSSSENHTVEVDLFKVGPEVAGVISRLQKNLATSQSARAHKLDVEYGECMSFSACVLLVHQVHVY